MVLSARSSEAGKRAPGILSAWFLIQRRVTCTTIQSVSGSNLCLTSCQTRRLLILSKYASEKNFICRISTYIDYNRPEERKDHAWGFYMAPGSAPGTI